MKNFFKKHYKRLIVFSLDFLTVLGFIVCRPISAFMLTSDTECSWLRFGFTCGTCGGTHFVNDFTSGRFISAFFDNQYIFFLTVYLLFSLVMLHFFLLGGKRFAKKILSVMYSIPALVIVVTAFPVFIFLRNLPHIIDLVSRFFEIIASRGI